MSYKNLVISGGGVHGISLITAFKALNNLDKMKSIEKVCGTSVGSMFGIFVVCKLNNQEIDYYTDKFYNSLTNFSESIIEQGYNMCNKMGLHDNQNIYNSVNLLLFDKYNIDNMTLNQLYEISAVDYTAVTMCLTTRKTVYLNYKTHPNLEVGKAIQMSSAVPFFFFQVQWNNMIFVDGGIVDNMPINYYDNDNGEFNNETLGLHFVTIKKNIYKTNNILDILEGIECCQIDNNEIQTINKYDKRNIIEIYVGSVGSLNFNLEKSEKELLLTNGYNAVIDYFDKHDKTQKILEIENMKINDLNIDNLNVDDLNVDDLNVDDLNVDDLDVDNLNVDDLNVDDLNVDDLNVNDLNVDDLNVDDLNVDDLNVNDLNTNDLNVDDLDVDNLNVDNLNVDDLNVDDLDVDDLDVDDLDVDDLDVDDLDVDDLDVDDLDVDDPNTNDSNTNDPNTNHPNTNDPNVNDPNVNDPNIDNIKENKRTWVGFVKSFIY
jgi:predicted patatin/cPLA2 family phospholipase